MVLEKVLKSNKNIGNKMASVETLYRQAPMTAKDYFEHAERYFKSLEVEYTTADCIAFASVMSHDFIGMMHNSRLEEIWDRLSAIAAAIEDN